MNNIFDISSPQKRERLLLIVAGIVFVIVLVPIFYQLFGAEVKKLRNDRNKLNADIEKLETDVRRQKEIKNRLDHLVDRSLPSKDDAKSLYQNYLMDIARETGIRESRIDTGSVAVVKVQNKTHYNKYTFTLYGKGSLEKISEFLRRFHKADYLHLVRKISPRPIKNSSEMDVSITIEALSLPQARASRTLPGIEMEQLTATDADKKMLKQITDRALFSVYTPPRPTPPDPGPRPDIPRPPSFDHSPYCFVTAVVEVDGKSQVWIEVRTEGKKYQLFEGEMFYLGTVRCDIKKIDFDRVQIECFIKKKETPQFESAGLYTVRAGKSFVEYE